MPLRWRRVFWLDVHAAEPLPSRILRRVSRFETLRFDVDGNTLLKPADIDAAVAAYTGADKDFSDIQRALETLEGVYRDRGYGVVQVLLPEQDITRGVVDCA